MSKSKTFTITKTAVTKARKIANVGGLDLADKRKLPTTVKKAVALSHTVDKRVTGLFKARAASHLVALGEGTYTAPDMFAAMRCGKSKAELEDLTGSNALYDDVRFIRNACVAFIVTGDMPSAEQARNVDLKTGLQKEPKPKKAKGANETTRKKGGQVPSAVTLANESGSRVTTDHEGDVVKIDEVSSRDVLNKVSTNSMAAFIANVTTQSLIIAHSHDADAKQLAFDEQQAALNRMALELISS